MQQSQQNIIIEIMGDTKRTKTIARVNLFKEKQSEKGMKEIAVTNQLEKKKTEDRAIHRIPCIG